MAGKGQLFAGTLGSGAVIATSPIFMAADKATAARVQQAGGSWLGLAPGTSTPVIDLVRQGGRSLGTLLPDDATLGLWEFGTDRREVLAPALLSPEHRAAWQSAVGRLAVRNTGTSLYTTILAAYTAARDGFVEGVPNQVFVFTDGRNEDSTDPASLAAALTATRDPKRPVQLSVVAYGQERVKAALEAVVKPVDGYVDTPQTVDEVGAVFIHVAAGGLHEHEA
jgi:hypothetical protein